MIQRTETTAERVCTEAQRWIGTPYRHQASCRGVGTDCLGLVRGIWRSIYGVEPEKPEPYTSDWAEAGSGDPLLDAAQRYCLRSADDELQIGDLIIFRWRQGVAAKHVGIFVGNQRFIHAYERAGVISSPLIPQWRKRIAGVFRFPEPEILD